jgi:hypothetical protein
MEREIDEVPRLLGELAVAEPAATHRIAACEAIAATLVRVGQHLWLDGYIIGPDRARDPARTRFGDERMVGLATVTQIGGALGTGAVTLLRTANNYGAAALLRQLVEIEYLASAFAEEHAIAADWLRASGAERRAFWSPQQLRNRADGRFLNSDYWHHCDIGGHPAPSGMSLLPGHGGSPGAYLWADLAGHLVGIWTGIRAGAATLVGPVPDAWGVQDVDRAIALWRETDGFSAAILDLGSILRNDPDALG